MEANSRQTNFPTSIERVRPSRHDFHQSEELISGTPPARAHGLRAHRIDGAERLEACRLVGDVDEPSAVDALAVRITVGATKLTHTVEAEVAAKLLRHHSRLLPSPQSVEAAPGREATASIRSQPRGGQGRLRETLGVSAAAMHEAGTNRSLRAGRSFRRSRAVGTDSSPRWTRTRPTRIATGSAGTCGLVTEDELALAELPFVARGGNDLADRSHDEIGLANERHHEVSAVRRDHMDCVRGEPCQFTLKREPDALEPRSQGEQT